MWREIARKEISFIISLGIGTAQDARPGIADALNRTLRRLKQYQAESEWVAATLDGALMFVEQAALLAVQGDAFVLRSQRGFEVAAGLSVPIKSAPALANAIQSKDPVVALRTPHEVSTHFASTGASERAHLFPILNGSRAVAVLLVASRNRVDFNALELIAGMASLVLERQANAALKVQIAPGPVLPALSKTEPAPATLPTSPRKGLPRFAAFPREVRAVHIRAQRFARVRVAEMQLSRPEACRAGREQNNVYLFLKKEIDAAREIYRSQFLTTSSIVDYLHLELVRTAAEGDESKLGEDYPGQLV